MSIFSKKQYDAIADFLNLHEPCDAEVEMWVQFFKKDNPDFNEDKFTKRAMVYCATEDEKNGL